MPNRFVPCAANKSGWTRQQQRRRGVRESAGAHGRSQRCVVTAPKRSLFQHAPSLTRVTAAEFIIVEQRSNGGAVQRHGSLRVLIARVRIRLGLVVEQRLLLQHHPPLHTHGSTPIQHRRTWVSIAPRLSRHRIARPATHCPRLFFSPSSSSAHFLLLSTAILPCAPGATSRREEEEATVSQRTTAAAARLLPPLLGSTDAALRLRLTIPWRASSSSMWTQREADQEDRIRRGEWAQ